MGIEPDFKQQSADAIVQMVTRRYGATLAQEDLECLRSRLQRAIGILSALDQVQLINSDEPDLIFRVEANTLSTGRHGS